MNCDYISTACFINKFLDTDDLNNLAKNPRKLRNFYIGTYPADIIPPDIKHTCCWIWNTDKADKSGQHWIAIWKIRISIAMENHQYFIKEKNGKRLRKK